MDYIIGGIILLILAFAIFYIIKAKKDGVKCIGCPHAKKCSSHGACPNSQPKTDNIYDELCDIDIENP